MMEIILMGLGFTLMGLGLIGCFVYKIPGPILAFLGILVLQYGADMELFSTTALIVCAVAVVVCKILDKYVPKLISKLQSFGKGGKWGCTIGSFIGIGLIASTANGDNVGLIIAMVIIGLIVIPFILAVLGELISKKNFSIAIKSGGAALTNYLISTLLQLSICVYCIYSAFTHFN